MGPRTRSGPIDPRLAASRAARSRPAQRLFARLPAAIAALAAVAIALAPAVAHADARTEARRHFRAGMALVAKREYQAAIEELKKANDILPHPNVVYNIARAYVELGDLEQGIAWYRQYLASEPPDRAQVAEIVAELEKRLASERAERAAPSAPVPVPVPAPAPSGAEPPAPDAPGAPGASGGDGSGSATTAPPESGASAGAGGAPPSAPPSSKPPAPPARPAKPARPIPGAARTEDVYAETVITASRGAQSPLDSPSSTTIITRQDIRLSGITRIPELLRRVAGMEVMQITGGDTNVSMRAFNSRLSNKLLVLVNGRSVHNDVLGSTFWESLTIDVDQIERIEVVRGAGSALYGANAFMGVVNIITVKPGDGPSGLRVGYGDHQQGYASLWSSGRQGDFAYRASVGWTRYPRWTREVGERRVDLTLSGADQDLGAQNVRIDLRANQRLGGSHELDVGGGYARSNLDVYGIGPFNDYVVEFDNSDVTAAYRSKHVSARVYWARLATRSSVNAAYRGHTLFEGEPNQNVVDAELAFSGDLAGPGVLSQLLQAGVGYRLKNIEWNYLQDDPPIENHGSVFLQDTLRIGSRVQIVASGRLDYVPYLKRIVPSPRGSFIFKPNDRQALRLSGSTAFRSPTFLESYLDLPIQLQLPGVELISSSKRRDDPELVLQPEQVVTAEASYLNQQSDFFEFELTAWYDRVSDLIQLAEPRRLTLSNKADGLGGLNPETGWYTVAFGGWANRCDIFHVFGGEVGARVYPVTGLDLFANYALNWTTQERPTGCEALDDRRSSRHKVNAGVQVRTKPGIDGEVTFHWQSEQTWAEQVATLSGIETQPFDLSGYTLVNGRVGYRFLRNRAEVSVTVFNALAGVFGDPPQMHPFGNRIGRRFMGFFSYVL